MNRYHLTRNKDKEWQLWTGTVKFASIIVFKDKTKREAVRESAAFMRRHGEGSLKIHRVNGQFQEERTYPRSADPRRSKG